MSKKSHAKHEHHEHQHPTEAGYDDLGPSFGDRHRRLVITVVILFVIFGTLLFAVSSILLALHK